MGKITRDLNQINIKALHHWLLKYEFSETQILLTKDAENKPKIVFLGSPKKKTFLDNVSEEFKGNIEILERDVKTGDEPEVYQKFYSFISKASPKVGFFTEDQCTGKLVEELIKAMPSDYEKVDATKFFEGITIKKTPEELENLEKGAKFLDFSFKKLIDQIEDIVDDDETVKMNEVSKNIKDILDVENNDDIKTFAKANPGIDIANLEYNSPICIQSGGNFSYDLATESGDKALKEDTILLTMYCEYAEVCASAARTLKINPTDQEKEDYILLRKAFAGLFKSIQIGKKISQAYDEVYQTLAKAKDEAWLKAHLGDNFGYGIGFKQRENSLEITPKNDTVIEENMVMFICLYFKDLEYRNGSGYGIMIGDTIVTTKNGCRNLTKSIRKNYEDISYVIDDSDDDEEEEKDNVDDNGIDNANITESRFRAKAMTEKRNEIKRKEHQDELLNVKLAELNERVANDEIVMSASKSKSKNMTDMKSYRNPKEVPQNLIQKKIYLDEKRDTILLPVNRKEFMIIHLAFIKSSSMTSGEGSTSFLRLNLHTPSAMNMNQSMIFPKLKGPDGAFLKELIFKSNDSKNLQITDKKIKEHIKKMKQLEKEREQNITMAKLEQLSLNKGKKVMMEYLVIRPNIATRKTIGALEAHNNGVRYTSNQNEKIDINYNNVKHAFFQPCDDELIVLVHFHLHNSVMIGNKKVKNVQFYQEAGSLVDDLDTGRKRKTMYMNEQEELEQEQRERELRVKLNAKFKRFVDNIANIANQNRYKLEFDMPYSELSFYGAPNKGIVKLMPTVNCLVNLTEFPPFVITLDDIEIVHFERVSFSIKNFDMVFVFKDFHTTKRICSIPRETIEQIKDWLDQVDILFSEGVMPLNWNSVLTEIRSDFNKFLEEGGWAFLRDDGSDAEGEDSEDDSAFEASLKVSSESSEGDFSEEEGDDEEEDQSSTFTEEEVSDVISWDEEERKAAEQERQKPIHKQAINMRNPKNKAKMQKMQKMQKRRR
jgi:nucleosome binding factor SPN SPT16 subunit